jgi:hypothetical protein
VSKLKYGAKSLFTIAMNAAKGIDQSVPEEVAKSRLDTCNKCPKLLVTGQCGACFCWIRAKCLIRQEKCPLGKWDSWTPEQE